jgi:hypothetical protein
MLSDLLELQNMALSSELAAICCILRSGFMLLLNCSQTPVRICCGGRKVEFYDISKTKFSGNICFLLYKLRNDYSEEQFLNSSRFPHFLIRVKEA